MTWSVIALTRASVSAPSLEACPLLDGFAEGERLPVEASHMLIAGAINFVVFISRRNDYHRGGTVRRMVTSVREVSGVDSRVLSSEVFMEGPDGRAVPHAPITCIDELMAHGYQPSGLWQ